MPFAPGKLVAVASRDGHQVARDEVDTAGPPAAVRLTPDKRTITADGRSLSYFTTDVVDAHGVLVPSADNAISFDVRGAGRLVGLDNGREEDAENYKASTREAFNGKALAIVASGDRPGPITVTATADGLAPARSTIFAAQAHGAMDSQQGPALAYVGDGTAGAPPAPPAGPDGRRELLGPARHAAGGHDRRRSGDGVVELLPQGRDRAAALLQPRAPARVGLGRVARRESVSSVRAAFTIDATHALPADIGVRYWDGSGWAAVSNPHVAPATASGQPTVVSFDPVSTTRLRLDLTSAHPKAGDGFLAISELEVPGVATALACGPWPRAARARSPPRCARSASPPSSRSRASCASATSPPASASRR